jgi:hypothetical protein
VQKALPHSGKNLIFKDSGINHMRNTLLAIMALASLLPYANTSFAEGFSPKQVQAFCSRKRQDIPLGTAMPGEYKVIYGPYRSSANCGVTLHMFDLRMRSGGRWPVTLERFNGTSWTRVIDKKLDPREKFGPGTYRAVLDNRDNPEAVPYKGIYSVPL